MYLYYITDRSQFPGTEADRCAALLSKIGEAARAGVDFIQLREKDLATRDLEGLASAAQAQIRAVHQNEADAHEPSSLPRTRLLINSRTDVVLAVGADGVHLRSDDVSANDVRQLIGISAPKRDRFLIARSCHAAREVHAAGTDFVVFAPVFEKADTCATGLAALREACRAPLPVIALGGVSLDNALSCIDAGAAGVAGIRLFQNNDISAVIRRLRG